MSEAESPSREELLDENAALEAALELSRKRLRSMQKTAKALLGRLELDTLLDDIIAQVSELVDCERASLFLVDEDRGELWSRVAEGLDKTEDGPKEIRVPLGQGVAGTVAKTGVALHLPDAYADERFKRDVDQQTGYRTRNLLCVPIPGKGDKPMGVVEALNKRGGGFSATDERLLEAVSHQVSVALTDALMFEELREKARSLEKAEAGLTRRVRELDFLVELEHHMAAAQDPQELFDVICERIQGITHAGAASVAVVDHKTAGLVFTAATTPGEVLLRRALSPKHGLVGACVESGEVINIPDAQQDARHDRSLAAEIGFPAGPVACVPIKTTGAAMGALEVLRGPGQVPFTDEDVRILSLVAGRVAGALILAKRRDQSKKDEQLKTIGHMLSGIVHDFKTPMTIISGYVQLMESEDDEAERARCAEIVVKQTEQMTSMTKELLRFARGDTDLLLRKVYCQHLARDLEDMLRALFKDSPVTVAVETQYKGSARLDEVKLKRALANLAKNAKEAMGDAGGRFTLTISQVGDQIEFACADTGPGLAPEIQGRLFESFATHGKEEGTGLGLAVVRKVAKDHHGEVRAESVPGAGATFRLRMPL